MRELLTQAARTISDLLDGDLPDRERPEALATAKALDALAAVLTTRKQPVFLLHTVDQLEPCISVHLTKDDRDAALLSFAVSQGLDEDEGIDMTDPDAVAEWLDDNMRGTASYDCDYAEIELPEGAPR